MPLLDHFRPPWKTLRPWEGFHSTWASALAGRLNHGLLPPHYVALPNVRLGGQLEIDVATLEQNGVSSVPGTATAPAVWTPPQPAFAGTIDFAHLDTFEVQVLHEEDTPHLVGAIELVSPSNKDRPSHRQALVIKCASYLQQGIGVMVVDVVTSRAGNLHEQLLQLLQLLPTPTGPALGDLYAASYRTVGAAENSRLETWVESLALGTPLPTLPLWIGEALSVPLNLEETYTDARATLLML